MAERESVSKQRSNSDDSFLAYLAQKGHTPSPGRERTGGAPQTRKLTAKERAAFLRSDLKDISKDVKTTTDVFNQAAGEEIMRRTSQFLSGAVNVHNKVTGLKNDVKEFTSGVKAFTEYAKGLYGEYTMRQVSKFLDREYEREIKREQRKNKK